MERYRAVWRPVEYHNQCIGVNPWKRALVSYLLPVVAFSTLFNIPKFFEVEILVKEDWEFTKEIRYNLSTNETIEVSFNLEYLLTVGPVKLHKILTDPSIFSSRPWLRLLEHVSAFGIVIGHLDLTIIDFFQSSLSIFEFTSPLLCDFPRQKIHRRR